MRTEPSSTSSREVLRHRGVRDLLTANFLLYTAVSLQAAALMKEVYDISGRKADLGWIGLAEFLPAALLVLVTGPLADRMDRKKMALVEEGPFLFTRNPMYTGLCGVAVGMALCLGTASPLVVPPLLFLLLRQRFVLREEAFLRGCVDGRRHHLRGRIAVNPEC